MVERATSAAIDKAHTISDPPPLDKYIKPIKIARYKTLYYILLNAIRNGAKASVLGFSIRAGLSFLLKLSGVIRKKITLRDAFLHSFMSEDSFRMCAFFGSFAFLWKSTNNILINIRRKDDKLNGFIAGFIAGLSVLIENKNHRIAYSQQFLVRGLQGLYNHAKVKYNFSFSHGDSLMFAYVLSFHNC